MDAKPGELKNENKSELFSAPAEAQESANETTKMHLRCDWWYNLVCTDNTTGIASKVAL